jgi:hypothetical protein
MKKPRQNAQPGPSSPAPTNVPIIPVSVLLELARVVERIRLRQQNEPTSAKPTDSSPTGPDETIGRPEPERADPPKRRTGRRSRSRS